MNATKEKSKFRLGLENFWYHYKWQSIIALFAVITIIVCSVQCAKRESYDVSAVFYVDKTVSDTAVKCLEEELTKYLSDFDENGEKNLQLSNLSYDHTRLETVNNGVANSQLLMSTVAAGEQILFIVDEYGYNCLMADEFRLFETYDFFGDKDNHCWNWRYSDLRRRLIDKGINLPDNLYFCLRRVKGTAVENNDDTKIMEQRSIEFMKKIIDGEG